MSCPPYYPFFKNLGNPLRIKIIDNLRKKPMSVSELKTIINVEQSKLSHALLNLKKCSIVSVKQIGKQRIYSLNTKTIIPILKIIDKHKLNFCHKCENESILR